MQCGHILVVDDDPDMGRSLADALTTDALRSQIVESGADALLAFRQCEFDAVVTDVRMPGIDGVELMTRLKHLRPDLPVILVTGQASIAAAVAAVKRGAYDYVTKPCEAVVLRTLVEEALASRPRGSGHARAVTPATRARPHDTEELVGRSSAMIELRAQIELVAQATSHVLILGETGTGKELVARAIHASSARRSQAFVTVNAAAVPDALLESEMFGHTRGAFTGATQPHRGYFVEADGGTLLLDEIGDMPLPLQAKLLRVLQAGEVRGVGAERSHHVDVRVLAATHQALPELVKAGRFREDLYYRLNVITLQVPPLRVRSDDIGELASVFLQQMTKRSRSGRERSLRPDLVEVLEHCAWPGNVRELENTIERLVVFSQDEVLTPNHLARVGPDAVLTKGPESKSIDGLIQAHVAAVLADNRGNKARAAKILGIDLSTLYRWLERWRWPTETPGGQGAAPDSGAGAPDSRERRRARAVGARSRRSGSDGSENGST